MTDQELMDFTRWWLGNLTESELPEEDLQRLMDMVRLQYPTASDCRLQYELTVATLEFLIRSDASGGSGQVGTGEVSKRSEKRGATTILVEYAVGTTGATNSSWDSVLEDLLANPNSIGCSVFIANPDTDSGNVIINVSKDRFDTGTPWRQNLLSPKKKSWYDV